MDNKRIEAYAKLLVRVGANVQKGQTVVITSSVDTAEFARLCVKEAYEAGARDVVMRWTDDEVTRLRYMGADDAVFDEFPHWRADMVNELSEAGACWLMIDSDDPDALSGVDPDKIRRAAISSNAKVKPYRDRMMTNFCAWSIGAVPNVKWARKVFPNTPDDEAVEKLWNAILDASRVYADGDPVKEWDEHVARLQLRVKILNDYNFERLEYKNSLGTDLTVRLPENHVWVGGSELTQTERRPFNPNIPTEEIFTSPLKDGVDGVVFASKPLVLNGTVVDKFSFRLEKGKIVDIKAEVGLDALKSAISTDEGASHLGEAALVPYHSPISQSGILFYNTLFDENAACHLAFGEAYPCLKGGDGMSREELTAAGLNDSIMHEDFMVGTPDLSIIGVTHDGERIPVFVDGDFAF